MNVNALLIGMVIPIVFCGCQPKSPSGGTEAGRLKGTISISGAFALYPMTVKWAELFMEKNPGVRIDISAGGAGKGMTDALTGMVDLGMFSREITQIEIDQGAWYIAVTNDGVLPTIHAENPILESLQERGMTRVQFMELFLSDSAHYWEEYGTGDKSSKINVYTRSDACGAAEMWGKYLGKNQESLYGIGVFGDPGMADAVRNDRYGIGYNNMVYVYDMKTRIKFPGLEVIPLDVNSNGVIDAEESVYGTLDEIMAAIQNGTYPSPPSRDLYFIARGTPSDPVVLAFLEWILTEGQQYVSEAGYVRLSGEKIQGELSKIRP